MKEYKIYENAITIPVSEVDARAQSLWDYMYGIDTLRKKEIASFETVEEAMIALGYYANSFELKGDHYAATFYTSEEWEGGEGVEFGVAQSEKPFYIAERMGLDAAARYVDTMELINTFLGDLDEAERNGVPKEELQPIRDRVEYYGDSIRDIAKAYYKEKARDAARKEKANERI